jgi:hypothetical protein
MDWLIKIKNWILYPYYQFKERQRIKRRIEELRKNDPFIYK